MPSLTASYSSQTPPEGFEIIVQPPKPTVTEAEMIEWLGATARFNNGTFFDNARGFDLDRYNKEIATKDKADRTEVGTEAVRSSSTSICSTATARSWHRSRMSTRSVDDSAISAKGSIG